MRSIRHITASGRLDEHWSYDRARRVVTLFVRVGNVSLPPIDVPVCSDEARRAGAYPVRRRDGETWIILPARYLSVAAAEPRAVVVELGREAVVLACTPSHVDDELVALDEDDLTMPSPRESLAPVPEPVTHVPCPVCAECPCCAGAGMVTAARAAQFAPTDPPPPEAA